MDVLTCRVETTTAILLRKRKFSDTSLIVSWCTESCGCIQTVAKGARRAKSPFAGKLDLFFEAEISIVRSRKSDLHTLTEVVVKNPFAGIRTNYLRMQAAAYFIELIEICTERDHREPELLRCCGGRLVIWTRIIQCRARSPISRQNWRASPACMTEKS